MSDKQISVLGTASLPLWVLNWSVWNQL